jgi:DNA repair exonuclease SbcCD ATPase subunit
MKLRELLGSKKAASADELQSALDEIEARNTELASKKAEVATALHAARIENAFGDNGEKVRALRDELDDLTEKIQALDLVAADLNEKLAGARERERGERLVAINGEIEALFAKRAKAVGEMYKALARAGEAVWMVYGGQRGNIIDAMGHLDLVRIQHDAEFRQIANGHKAIGKTSLAGTLADLREEARTLRGE